MDKYLFKKWWFWIILLISILCLLKNMWILLFTMSLVLGIIKVVKNENRRKHTILIVISALLLITFSLIKVVHLYNYIINNPESYVTIEESSTDAKKDVSPPSMINSAKNDAKSQITSDITKLEEKPNAKQQDILDSLAHRHFNERYPFKGSKIHSILGVIQNWIKNGDSWFYKANATINNSSNVKRDCYIEITITPVTPDSGFVSIIDY
ncbi:hypothetical protein BBX37_14295 [Listeria monocytogenes]|nr:hypothetical protein [Listeria monocytogenes]EAG1759787.1 hypothetical protein [Listeria monocytogenes]MCR61211.1 hypothetical protein [Listeria monocytogenes]